MKAKLTEPIVKMLKDNKGLFLLLNNHIFVLENFKIKIEEVPCKNFWGKKTSKTKKVHYLTKIDILTQSKDGEFGYVTDENAAFFVRIYNFYELRKKWVELKEQIEKFGFKIIPQNESNTQ